MAEIRDFDELSYGKEIKEFEVITALNLREEPSTKASIIRILNKGEKIKGFVENSWIITSEGACMAIYVK